MTRTIKLDEFDSSMTIRNEFHVADTALQILQVDIRQPFRSRLRDDSGYHLDLSLSPRTRTGMRFPRLARPGGFREVGPLFLIPPGEEVQTRTDQGKDVIFICRLPGETVNTLCDTEPNWSDDQLDAGLDIRCARLERSMRRLADELTCPGFASGLLIETIMVEIAIELTRYRRTIVDRADIGLAPWRLRLIDDQLRAAPRSSLATLAAACGLSVRHLSRGFRASRGMSLGKHVADMQLDAARSRLASGESVKEVAYASGFRSPAAFCHSFRRSTGETPTQFRHSLLRRGR